MRRCCYPDPVRRSSRVTRTSGGSWVEAVLSKVSHVLENGVAFSGSSGQILELGPKQSSSANLRCLIQLNKVSVQARNHQKITNLEKVR